MGHAVNEIADFPIQTVAAQLLQSSQFEVHKAILRQGLRAVVILNIYDSLYIDCPPDEEKNIDEIMRIYLTEPPLLAILSKYGYSGVPIEYEKES